MNREFKDIDVLDVARKVLMTENEALTIVASQLDDDFLKTVDLILSLRGRLIVTGIGKSGIVGRKISATLASTGTPAYFLHPAEGFHGDLGLILSNDAVMMISNSGETEEILNLLPSLQRIKVKLISLTAKRDCTLARKADVSLVTGVLNEADPMNLVPTSTTTAAMALGDALAVALLMKRGFEEGDFAQFHPGGSLGRKLLLKLSDLAFEGKDNPVVFHSAIFREAHHVLMKKHLGAVSVVDSNGKLIGIITDGDVRRLLENNESLTISEIMQQPVEKVMTANPKNMHRDTLAVEGLAFMHKYLISQLPLVDDDGKSVGLVRLLDLIKAGIPVQENEK
jgi:arabinose-5-phosphate isomerase